jgi:hypothetical protein
MISFALSAFSLLNLNGMLGLFLGVSMCLF